MIPSSLHSTVCRSKPRQCTLMLREITTISILLFPSQERTLLLQLAYDWSYHLCVVGILYGSYNCGSSIISDMQCMQFALLHWVSVHTSAVLNSWRDERWLMACYKCVMLLFVCVTNRGGLLFSTVVIGTQISNTFCIKGIPLLLCPFFVLRFIK